MVKFDEGLYRVCSLYNFRRCSVFSFRMPKRNNSATGDPSQRQIRITDFFSPPCRNLGDDNTEQSPITKRKSPEIETKFSENEICSTQRKVHVTFETWDVEWQQGTKGRSWQKGQANPSSPAPSESKATKHIDSFPAGSSQSSRMRGFDGSEGILYIPC